MTRRKTPTPSRGGIQEKIYFVVVVGAVARKNAKVEHSHYNMASRGWLENGLDELGLVVLGEALSIIAMKTSMVENTKNNHKE
jgi:hypothetical protein